ncbi:MAG: T9SS type A sorting domain-containing protein [Bacteroidia bacterium]
MKKLTILYGLIFLPFLLLSQEGELDLSFNGNGKYILDLHTDDEATSVLIQPDEKILIGATVTTSRPVSSVLVRLDRYGNADLGFGNQGVAEVVWDDYEPDVQSIALDGNQNILALARASYQSESGVLLTRFDPNGNLDQSFADSGMVFIGDWDGSSTYWTSVIAMPDGEIVVSGYTFFTGEGVNGVLLGFNHDGSPNFNFGDNGMVKFNLGGSTVQIHKLILNQNNKILAIGSGYSQGDNNFLLAQFNQDGSFNSGFGGNGILTVPFGENSRAYGADIQEDGKIILAGDIYMDSDYAFALARLLPDGTLDQSFGTNGKVITPVLKGDAYAKSVSVLGDGKILVAGDADGIWNRDFALVRYHSDGSLDPSFSLDGIATKNIGNRDDHAKAAAIQPNGRLVIVGGSFVNDFGNNVICAARFLGGAGITGIDEFEETVLHLHIYPNPASDRVRIEAAENVSRLDVRLIDQQGRVVRELSASGREAEFDVNGLSPGLYLLKIVADGKKVVYRKVMVGS